MTFFLVLSGFVMSYNYYDKFEKLEKNDVKQFIRKRIKKLYPIHILTFFIALPFSLKILIDSPIKEIGKIGLNMSLLHSFIPNNNVYFSFNSVSWYLSACILFYILTPFLINLIHKVGKNKLHLLGYGILIYLFIFTLVYIGRYSNNAHWLFYISPFFRIFDYILGILTGVYIKIIVKKNKNIFFYTLYEVLSLILFASAYYFYPYINQTFTYGVYYLPFVIFIVIMFGIQKGYISQLLSNPFLVYLGGISFEFYMIHQLVIRYITYIVGDNYPITISIVCMVISIVSAILLNTGLNYYYAKFEFSKDRTSI